MELDSLDSLSKVPDKYWWKNATTLGGFDVGKRGNPSHCSIFGIKNEPGKVDDAGNYVSSLIMVHQKFLDNWDYTRQVEYLTEAVEYFGIEKLYYDNTRGELEERSLPRQCIPVILSNRTGPRAKGKVELATNFAKLVEQQRIKIIDEDRFISQITCVTGDLQAPNTPRGHGDSFISIMLAVSVYYDYYASDRHMGTTTIGNVQDMVGFSEKETLTNTMVTKRDISNERCKICGSRDFEVTQNGIKKLCKKCYTIW
jgi:hypothetical protein